ncbi:MAG: M4 family metallopeptidase [Deltaproteobacteria bacterium]|nr:M4 family metallopeptidase [Deltaproteobacteria bacterium]
MNDHNRKTNHYWVLIAFLILLSGFCLRFFDTASATTVSPSHDSLASVVTLSGGVDDARFVSRKATGMPSRRYLKTRQGTATPHLMSLEMTKKIRSAIAGNSSPRRKDEKMALITNAQCENLRSLVAANQFGKGVRSHFNRKNGTPAFIKLPKMREKLTRNTRNLAMSQSVAEKFLMDNRNLLKLSEPTKELVHKKHWVDRFGTKHFRYHQTYQGIPLWGKGVMVHLDAYDSVYLCQCRYEPTPESLDITPEITVDEALETTMRHLGITTDCLHSAKTALVIYTASDGGMTLTYKVDISSSIDQRWLYFVDADSGEVIHRINNIHNTVVNASSQDLNFQNRTFNAWLAEGAYYLIDPTIPLANPPYAPVPDIKSSGNTYILDARNGDSELYFITSSSADSGWDSAGVSAAHNTRKVYDYYKNTFGRNGINDNNMNYLIVVHLKENYANAFWNGKFVCFGDGDNQTFSALSGSLDITAHEIQHGVTEFTAGLIYENQSGALNEAYSDIFACMVDREDWTVGEDITLVSPGYLRNLANPALGLDPLPTKMSEYRNLPNTEQGDHGGVHINMSIPSRAAYLMAEGLTAEGLGTSIGRDKTEKVFYRALTTYLQASSNFLDARVATLQAAEDFYGAGSTEVCAVRAAWDVVEVTEGNVGTPDDQTPTPTEPVSGEDLMVYLYPIDGTHDNPYDSSEAYNLYVQTIPSPFTGYDPNLDAGPLNIKASASYTRPAVYTGPYGTVIFYVGSDNNLYAVDNDGNETSLTETGDIWSFAISPDGRYFACTTVYEDDNNIYVGDIETGLVTEYPAKSSSDLPPGSEEAWNTIFYIDSLAFDYTGKMIVFDALNCLSTPGNSCSLDSGGGYQYWSIGFLNLSNGSFDFPLPDQSPDFDVEYPSFAYNNNFVVLLDVLDYSDYYTHGAVSSMVWTMNWQTQISAQVADPNLGSNSRGVSGVPSFWGDDDYVTVQALSDTDGRAYRIPIDASWAGNESAAELLNDDDVAMPVMHRAVARTLTGTIQLSSSFLDFGNVNIGDTSNLNLTLTNTGNRDINIYNIEISGSSAFSHNGSNGLLPHGQSMTMFVDFLPGQTSGTQAGTLTITSDADSPTTSIALTGTGNAQNGYLVTPDLWIRAVINTVEKGPVEAIWKKNGEDTTSRGDSVIYGHFYADPNDVTWGSQDNPDLFVKIWFDVSGRVDVNYFHVSVPDIEVYSDYSYDGTTDEQGTTTMSRRYIRQYYENGRSYSDENYEDGNPPSGYSSMGNPSGFSTIKDLRIGAIINTVEKGPIDAIWQSGGQDITSRGDRVVWGHFYASPSDVTWGSQNNPDLFIKIWFDVSGRVDVNFFHVSVPDIEVYSDLPSDGTYDQRGTTIMTNRYIRHEYLR